MARQKRMIKQEESTVETVREFAPVEAGHNGSDSQSMVEQLKAQLAEREAQIAALSARKPRSGGRPARVATLETVIAKQSKTPAKWAMLGVAAQVNERVAVGQDEAEAFQQVTDAIEEGARGILSVRDEYNSLMEAAWGYLKVAAPKGALSRGIKLVAQVEDAPGNDEDEGADEGGEQASGDEDDAQQPESLSEQDIIEHLHSVRN